MKKIVFAINDLQGSGAERYVTTLYSAFTEMGHECHIICFKKVVELSLDSELRIHHFQPPSWYSAIPRKQRDVLISRKLDQFVLDKIGTPDLLLSNLMSSDRLFCHSRLPNVHLVVHINFSADHLAGLSEKEKNKKLKRLNRIYLKKPCVCVGQGVKDNFDEVMKPSIPSVRIYNPVDVDFLHNSSTEYAVEPKDYIVHIGKFKPVKRHDLLLNAYKHSGVSNPVVLLGKGKTEAEINALAHKLDINDKVVFGGFQSNPYPYLSNARLMVVSSDYEGFSIAILEAIALGIPVVSTDCPSGPREILPPQNLVPVDDPAQLGDKIKEAIANPELYKVPFSDVFSAEYAATEYMKLAGKEA